jgi:hypothetical protein
MQLHAQNFPKNIRHAHLRKKKLKSEMNGVLYELERKKKTQNCGKI